MRRGLTAAFLFFWGASCALAYTDAGGRYTAGPDGYAGVNAFAEWGDDDYYLRPSVNTYKSDLADRYTSYTLGAGLDRGRWSAGGELSLTPETGGYKNSSLYGDLSYSLLGDGGAGALEDAVLGVFAGYTAHEDLYAASTTTVSGGRRSAQAATGLTSAFKLGQTDLGATAALKLFGSRLSGRFTKTVYDQDITALNRQLPLDIGGIGASGFPDRSVSARLRFTGLPLSPEAGYLKTWYLLDQPSSESISAGLSCKLGQGEVSAGWENFNPGGGAARQDYYSIGFTWSFGD